MKITKRQLQGVIAESINRVLREEKEKLSLSDFYNILKRNSWYEMYDGLIKKDGKIFGYKYYILPRFCRYMGVEPSDFDIVKKELKDVFGELVVIKTIKNPRQPEIAIYTVKILLSEPTPIAESINRVLNEVGDTPNGQRKLGALAARKKEQGDDDAFHDTIRYASKAAAKKGDIYMGEPYFSDGFVSYKYPNCPNHNKGRKPLKEGFYEKDGTYYAQCWEDVYEWEKNTHIPKDKVDAVMVLIRNLDGEYYRNAKIEEETIQLLNRGGVWWGVSKGLIIEEHLSNNEERNTFFESMQDLGFVVTDRYTDGSSYSYERTNYIEFSYKPLICRFGFKG